MPTVNVSGAPLNFVDAGRGGGPERPSERGGGPALVLLHAFPLHSGMWADQVAAVSPHRRVVAPDLPGFGSTPGLGIPDAATVAGYADLVAGLIGHLDLGPAVVCGLSMGGYVTFALLRDHPHLVAGVVLADTRAAADSEEIAQRRTAQQAQVVESGTAELVETMLANLLSQETRSERPDVVERTRALMAVNSPAGVIAALAAMKARPDATAELGQIAVPALVVVGEHDKPSPPDEAAAMADAIADAHLEVIPGAGHLSNLEAPEAFNQAVESFLTRF